MKVDLNLDQIKTTSHWLSAMCLLEIPLDSIERVHASSEKMDSFEITSFDDESPPEVQTVRMSSSAVFIMKDGSCMYIQYMGYHSVLKIENIVLKRAPNLGKLHHMIPRRFRLELDFFEADTEKDLFIEAIRGNLRDMVLRGVYADWLDDHGDHDLATQQREVQTSIDFFEQFIKEVGCTIDNYGSRTLPEVPRDFTLDDIYESGFDSVVQAGRETARSWFYDGTQLALYQKHWIALTGGARWELDIEDDGTPAKWPSKPFDCTC